MKAQVISKMFADAPRKDLTEKEKGGIEAILGQDGCSRRLNRLSERIKAIHNHQKRMKSNKMRAKTWRNQLINCIVSILIKKRPGA